MRFTSFGLAALLVASVGCVSSSPSPDAAPPPLDPSGTWALSDAWSTGNCGETGATPETLTIAHGTVATSAPNTAAMGTFACSWSTCDVEIHETTSGTASGVAYTGLTHYMLSLHDGTIVGAGSVNVMAASGSSCTQVFNTTGTFTP